MIKTVRVGAAMLGIVLLVGSGCKKERILPETVKNQTALSELPPLTTRGANTFACKIDGKIWIPEGNFSEMGSLKPINTNYSNGKLYIYGVRSKDKIKGRNSSEFQTLALTVFSDFSRKIRLSAPTRENDIYSGARGFFSDWSGDKCEYETNKLNDGTLTIVHHDSINRIISGTFEFQAFSKECNRTINVTEGRFDVRY